MFHPVITVMNRRYSSTRICNAICATDISAIVSNNGSLTALPGMAWSGTGTGLPLVSQGEGQLSPSFNPVRYHPGTIGCRDSCHHRRRGNRRVQGRDDTVGSVSDNSQLGIPHHVVSFQSLFGFTLDSLLEVHPLRACTACGILRKKLFLTLQKRSPQPASPPAITSTIRPSLC